MLAKKGPRMHPKKPIHFNFSENMTFGDKKKYLHIAHHLQWVTFRILMVLS